VNPAADDDTSSLRAERDALAAQLEDLQAEAARRERLLDVARTAMEETVFLASESKDVLDLESLEWSARGQRISLYCEDHDRRVRVETLSAAIAGLNDAGDNDSQDERWLAGFQAAIDWLRERAKQEEA